MSKEPREARHNRSLEGLEEAKCHSCVAQFRYRRCLVRVAPNWQLEEIHQLDNKPRTILPIPIAEASFVYVMRAVNAPAAAQNKNRRIRRIHVCRAIWKFCMVGNMNAAEA